MKVNDPNLTGAVGGASVPAAKTTQTGRVGSTNGASRTTETTSAGGDGVALSSLAQSLRATDSESPERAAQVAALEKAYAEGSYNVDAEAVAGKIVDEAVGDSH
jgi:flagellar biosynthesis anti-sigma factor FlgM